VKVSIITVVYNGASTLRDCIDSVLRQSYQDIEYLVIDGGSTDGTVELVRSYGSRITRFVSEPDQGLYDAMNKGLRLATGDLIGILNADDFYRHDQVIERVAALADQENSEAIYGDLVYVDANDTRKITRYWSSGKYRKGAFRWGWMPPHPTFFVRRSVYLRFGLFQTRFRSAADYELMLRFVHRHGIKVSYLKEVLVVMRAGGVSNRTVGNRLNANREDQEAWELNGIKPYFFTHWLKPMRKIFQFFPGLMGARLEN